MRHLKLFEAFDKDKEEPWWKEFTKYQLSAYPVNIPKEDVTVDLTGDIDSKPVMTWNSPKTGKKVYSYTKKRVDAQKALKYARIEKLSNKQIENIKAKCYEDILSETTSEDTKEAAAIVCIITETGLRPGSRKGFQTTQNRGVITLSKDNVTIDGPNISLDFTGKSYKHNVSEIEDGILANYLETKITGNGEDFVFNITKSVVDRYYKMSLGMKGFKIKDLRTYIAGKIAKWFLKKHKVKTTDPKSIKKEIKDILKETFDYVSQKLNNSPAMAKGSYVNPVIITDWLDSLGIQPTLITEDTPEELEKPKEFIGNAPLYAMPDWWDDEDIDLVK